MSSRPLVLLDAAGVLVFEDDARVLSCLSDAYRLDPNQVNDWLEGEAYDPWWTGRWQWPDFWAAFSDRFGVSVTDQERWQHEWSSLRPMHPLSLLGDWAQWADLWLVSDHRADWLLPVLGDQADIFQMIWISDQVGLTKKDPALFDLLSSYIPPGDRPIYYLDDRPHNLDLARRSIPGLHTFRADPAGRWTSWLYRSLAGGA